ncbi:Larval cuticle protein A1A, partial [Melipona quadrifasciata]
LKFQLIILISVAVLSKGAVVPAVPAALPAAKLEELDASPQYSFAYDVQDALTGDSKAQYETRNGDLVQGSYSLIEADGTRRIVEYTADPINGFNAVVSREPATAVAAIAAPLVPYAPAIAPPVAAAAAPVLPAAAAPAPAIPSSGPDSDVEVVEARSGPLGAPVKALATPVQLAAQPARLVAAKPLASYAAYPGAYAYTAAYTSPLAYAAPLGGLTYASAPALL